MREPPTPGDTAEDAATRCHHDRHHFAELLRRGGGGSKLGLIRSVPLSGASPGLLVEGPPPRGICDHSLASCGAPDTALHLKHLPGNKMVVAAGARGGLSHSWLGRPSPRRAPHPMSVCLSVTPFLSLSLSLCVLLSLAFPLPPPSSCPYRRGLELQLIGFLLLSAANSLLRIARDVFVCL